MKKLLWVAVVALVLMALVVPGAMASASTDHEFRFSGQVRQMPHAGLVGDWKIGGRTVHVSAVTSIDQTDGQAKLGARVRVEGFKEKNGSVDALSIDILPR